MVYTVKNNNHVYIYMNGNLIHKTNVKINQSGVTFGVMAYRKNDSLKSIK